MKIFVACRKPSGEKTFAEYDIQPEYGVPGGALYNPNDAVELARNDGYLEPFIPFGESDYAAIMEASQAITRLV